MRPNFFIVGAAKSGTTSLWRYMKQHPDVFFPDNKEPNFFAYEAEISQSICGPADPEVLLKKLHSLTVTSFDVYQDLFRNASSAKAVGEASVRYLYFPQACERIFQSLPDSKIIIILRNPVNRLYSHFLMMKGMYSLEPLSLSEALEQEESRISAKWDWDWHYVQVSMYFDQVRRYLETFGSSNVRVFVYEEFCQSPLQVVQEIFRFLDVDDNFVPDMSARSMQAYWPRSTNIDQALRSPNRINSAMRNILPTSTYARLVKYGMRLNKGKPPRMPNEMREQLSMTFQQDVVKLEHLLGRKLPW